jgi:hypothetical protein
MKNTPHLTEGYEPTLAMQIKRSRPGMAHFAATGPFGTTCKECIYLGDWKQTRNASGEIVSTKRWGGCRKFRELTGKHGDAVPPGTESCRYFLRRESDESV